jgi:hypothetical protein
MNRFTALLLNLFAFVFSNHAIASDADPATEADKKFLTEIVNAVQKGNMAWIADHMLYPISITVSNKTQIVKTKEEFKPVLDRELSPEIRTNIVDAAREPLFKNWQGVMIGDGILWFTEFIGSKDNSYYEIDAIGDFAFQPSEPVLSSPSGH